MTGVLDAEWSIIRHDLGKVARPNSRFHLDLESFIPAFDGIAVASARAIAHPVFETAKLIFVTPDNSMQPLRREALARGKTLLVPSYGLHRGFLRLGPGTVPPDLALYASWGDGIQYFAEPVALDRLAEAGQIDLVLAGAAAVASNGRRFGMGHRYLDVEWNIFATAGMLDATTPVWTVVHDCQVADGPGPLEADSICADCVFTPTRQLSVEPVSRPVRVRRSTLDALFAEPGTAASLAAHLTLVA